MTSMRTATSTIRGFRARSNPSFQSNMVEQDFLGEVEMTPTNYDCPADHVLTIPFAASAEIPDEWVCLKHQLPALRVGAEAPVTDIEETATQTPMYPGAWFSKHHWKCLQERRTPEEAEEILNNALAAVRERRNAA